MPTHIDVNAIGASLEAIKRAVATAIGTSIPYLRSVAAMYRGRDVDTLFPFQPSNLVQPKYLDHLSARRA